MSIIEDYKRKVSKRGTGFLEFYLWIFCPLLAIRHIYNIVTMAIGKTDFAAVGFIYSLLAAALAITVTATAIFLDRVTFWIDISIPIVFILSRILMVIAEVGAITGLISKTGNIWNLGIQAASIFVLIGDAVVLIICAAFLFYFVDHRDIYGY